MNDTEQSIDEITETTDVTGVNESSLIEDQMIPVISDSAATTNISGTSTSLFVVPDDRIDDRIDGRNNDRELEYLLLCEGIAAGIIHNFDTIGVYVCTQCGETIHGHDESDAHILATTTDVIDHVQGHFRNNAFNGVGGIHICTLCYQEFSTRQALSEHRAEVHENRVNQNIQEPVRDREMVFDPADSEDSSDQENMDHLYRCPVCERGYNDQLNLGIHFMQQHNNYSELNVLDQRRSDGFPGIELLNKIGMVRYVTQQESIDNNICVLCCNTYDHRIRNNTDDNLTEDKKELTRKYRQFSDDMKLIYMSTLDHTYRHPLKLMCCKAELCTECLQNHIKSRFGDPECPFCRKSHLQTHKRFIIYDERPPKKIKQNPDPYPLVGKKRMRRKKVVPIFIRDNDDNQNSYRNDEFIEQDPADYVQYGFAFVTDDDSESDADNGIARREAMINDYLDGNNGV